MARKRDEGDFEQGKERLDEMEKRFKSLFGESRVERAGIGGLLGGLGNLIEALGDLAKKAEASNGETHRMGKFGTEPGIRGVWGLSFKSGLGKEEPTIEPFGNIKRDRNSGEVVVESVREPLVDMFDEQDRLLIIAELPGVVQDDIQLQLHDDVLELSAARGEIQYHKEVLLPASFSSDQMGFTCRNGILEVTLMKS